MVSREPTSSLTVRSYSTLLSRRTREGRSLASGGRPLAAGARAGRWLQLRTRPQVNPRAPRAAKSRRISYFALGSLAFAGVAEDGGAADDTGAGAAAAALM